MTATFDVGFGRDDVSVDIANVDLADGEPHLVTMERKERGKLYIVTVGSMSFTSHTQ